MFSVSGPDAGDLLLVHLITVLSILPVRLYLAVMIFNEPVATKGEDCSSAIFVRYAELQEQYVLRSKLVRLRIHERSTQQVFQGVKCAAIYDLSSSVHL
jgi:hypothetical protein